MMQLEVDGRRFGVTSGETVVGSDPSSGILLEGEGVQPRHLIVAGLADGSAAVRVAEPQIAALLNGVTLGTDPTPILHGDKLRVGEREILVIDPAQAGVTRLAPAVRILDADSLPPPSRPAGLGPARLVSLTDGREYRVDDQPLVFGRDASADIVVGADAASRRHAEVRPTAGGYVLVDHSSNGTTVNGLPVEGSRVLARGDVIAIGPDEFRFTVEPAELPDEVIRPKRPTPNPQLNDTLFGVPAFVPSPAAPAVTQPLAALLVRSGASKGQRLLVRSPVANIGRADYNDVVVNDVSVSSAHAKLQLREDVWILTDLGSTNGTFVDGEPALGEMPLGPGATIKLGAVRLMFEPLETAGPPEQPIANVGTQQIAEPQEAAVADVSDVRAAESPSAPAAAPPAEPPAVARRPVRPPRASVAQESSSSRTAAIVAGLIVVAAAVIAYMLLS